MARLGCLFVILCIPLTQASVTPIATFDGAKTTTLRWQTVNDPVMGGQSKSTFEVDTTNHLGIWAGEVKIVPFLHAPGFCNLQSPGLFKTATFPDVSALDGLVVRAKETNVTGLKQFNIQLMSKGAKRLFQQGVYMASVNITTEMVDHFVPWSAFSCTVRGSTVSWCPKLTTQLKEINSVGFGTFFPGPAGTFRLEIESLSASSAKTTQLDVPSSIDLATFDGKAPHKWHSENDPVMGGKSSSTVEMSQGFADYKGTTRIVPSLKAPGFTIAMTEGFPFLSKFPDVSSMDGLTISVRNIGNFTGYKIAFCDSHINFYRCQVQSFKADLVIPSSADGGFQDVFVPWSKFSDKWNAATGKHTAENPPGASSLNSITQLQIWTEAVEGDFHLQFQYVRASKAPVVTLVV
mmetsp:Transcript_37567/g.74620  ORF Transcript_37567/g.74620 Transcript_37567/m.74620 type:complete len:406 (-) Transcript_37567:208-1425(-)|eukprot:CAMPEP_0172669194 /NCGR_PEP_ID=MMETSP1074-20121228/9524_1 /TAXON_ID=2916 /ORGANISM="Ceratium fusus, Strain PA161109" /LENGTH=405 /DNA_ID=CAMNT_0013485939 /DNA_START=59 /DNA_END=1276 /DNA_ORIENTATION=+